MLAQAPAFPLPPLQRRTARCTRAPISGRVWRASCKWCAFWGRGSRSLSAEAGKTTGWATAVSDAWPGCTSSPKAATCARPPGRFMRADAGGGAGWRARGCWTSSVQQLDQVAGLQCSLHQTVCIIDAGVSFELTGALKGVPASTIMPRAPPTQHQIESVGGPA